MSKCVDWLYSWLKAKVETEVEYKISKALLFQYVMHPDQVAILGNANCDKIINFIREHVVPSYEQNSCFFHRISIDNNQTETTIQTMSLH